MLILCASYSSTEVLTTFYIAGLNWCTGDVAVADGTDSTRNRPVLLESQLQLCIICQFDNQQKLMNVSHDGLQSVDNIRQLRTKLPNVNFRDATDRLTEIFQADAPQTFSWLILIKTVGQVTWANWKLNAWWKLDWKRWMNQAPPHPGNMLIIKNSVYGVKRLT